MPRRRRRRRKRRVSAFHVLFGTVPFTPHHLTASPCPRVPTASPCGQPLEEGGCERYTLRWYYSQRGAECRPFVYSGCGGNANRFGSRHDCELRCGGHCLRLILAALTNLGG
uniref:BPTI/Kunitz inhibitor domain-containing protein n=1 Tax=Anas platyrhynchos platyrhynchos TaxID=8840 RepID=A0A493SS94_ANAPP